VEAGLRGALVFIGFMGAGKSAAAREAAAALGVEALDADRLLEDELGSSIEEFFEREGEAAFREHEERLVCALLDRPDARVVALGGGAVLSEHVRAALHRHTTVLLEVDPDTAWARAAGQGRPLARDVEGFRRRYDERLAVYEALADAFLPQAPPGVAGRALPALRTLKEGTRLIWATAPSGEYPVVVGADAAFGAPWPLAGRRFVVTDSTVGDLYAARLGEVAVTVVLPPGEEHKSLASAERVWHELAGAAMARDDHVVALGGGVVGDLAGFCAATYQRGVPIVHVPTTLVAQVDSAYGGKTGVDLPEAKNYVGAYHQPAAVLVDPQTLATLPTAERAAGYAEVLKTALIAGGTLWERVAAGGPVDEAVILTCARTKLAIVAVDERDAGRRQVLNLGHTFAHAIETATGYRRYRHGEAVGLGLLAALRLSGLDELRAQVVDLLATAGLPVRLEGADVETVVEATGRDKKRRSGEAVGFVVLDAPGSPRVGVQAPADEVRGAVAELLG
jgi:shikimate kinase/3-dehydroquinate synthase